MQDRALITSASNKFFPSLINLLGSIKQNYPQHPPVYIYDLGLSAMFRKELERIPGITLLKVPPFVPFWRACYTWKTYIFAHPLAKLNFYLDAGCQVLKSLDGIFVEIDRDGYFLVSQKGRLADIVPYDYKAQFNLSEAMEENECLHAGVFGFKENSAATKPIEFVFEAAKKGLALGFSPNEQWRNKGADKNPYVRDCKMFRHDMTLLNIGFRKFYGTQLVVHSMEQYAGWKNSHPEQYIWQLRLGYRSLDFVRARFLHHTPSLVSRANRIVIGIIVVFKNINLSLKKFFGLIS